MLVLAGCRINYDLAELKVLILAGCRIYPLVESILLLGYHVRQAQGKQRPAELINAAGRAGRGWERYESTGGKGGRSGGREPLRRIGRGILRSLIAE